MKFTEINLKGCFVIDPPVFKDSRGFFFESFRQDLFDEITGLNLKFVQDNQSESAYGVIRGLHMQTGEFGQDKLVSVLKGKILDVAVDVRKDSPTFGEHYALELSEENKRQFFIPKGFLHGFSVLSEKAVVFYKCSNYYNKKSEAGAHPLDETLGIDWRIPEDKMILSDKDKNADAFTDIFKTIK